MKRATCSLGLLALLGSSCAVLGTDLAALCADRAALERVYHAHRIGTQQTFEQAMPRELIEKLTRQDMHKEAVLQKVYGVEITPAMVAAEMQRIDATTRAPEVLAELKHALGDDAERFARSMARPIVVERDLRGRFDNDDRLHAPQRRLAEEARNALLTARQNGADGAKLLALLKRSHPDAVTETVWQLGARPEEKPAAATEDALAIQKRFGPGAQLLSAPQAGAGKERKVYFADLSGELQNVLRVQLRQAGDVSAVIETHRGFLLFLTREVSAETLSAASLSLPKGSYEEWLSQQPE